MSKKILSLSFLLFLLGLWLRISGLQSIGGNDSEFWRAWGHGLQSFGLSRLYADKEDSPDLLRELELEGCRSVYKFQACPGQRVLPFDRSDYFRKEFIPVQPPLFMLDVGLSIWLAKFLSEELNLPVSDYLGLSLVALFQAFILLLIVTWVFQILNVNHAFAWALIGVWMNPVLILSTPWHGYRDILLLCFLFTMLGLALKQKFKWAGLVFGLGLMTKPSALFLLPALLLMMKPLFFITALAPAGLFATYFFLHKTLIGTLLSWTSVTSTMSECLHEGVGFFRMFDPLTMITGVELCNRSLGTLILGVILILSLWLRKRVSGFDVRSWQFLSLAFLLCFSFHFFRPGSQVNHYVPILIFLIPLIAFADVRRYAIALLGIMFMQDFVYYGLGRSYIAKAPFDRPLLDLLSLAAFAVGLFLVRDIISRQKVLGVGQ